MWRYCTLKQIVVDSPFEHWLHIWKYTCNWLCKPSVYTIHNRSWKSLIINCWCYHPNSWSKAIHDKMKESAVQIYWNIIWKYICTRQSSKARGTCIAKSLWRIWTTGTNSCDQRLTRIICITKTHTENYRFTASYYGYEWVHSATSLSYYIVDTLGAAWLKEVPPHSFKTNTAYT